MSCWKLTGARRPGVHTFSMPILTVGPRSSHSLWHPAWPGGHAVPTRSAIGLKADWLPAWVGVCQEHREWAPVQADLGASRPTYQLASSVTDTCQPPLNTNPQKEHLGGLRAKAVLLKGWTLSPKSPQAPSQTLLDKTLHGRCGHGVRIFNRLS